MSIKGLLAACLSAAFLHIVDALMLARELGCLPEFIELYGMEIDSSLPGSQLSERVIRAAQALADRIATELG